MFFHVFFPTFLKEFLQNYFQNLLHNLFFKISAWTLSNQFFVQFLRGFSRNSLKDFLSFQKIFFHRDSKIFSAIPLEFAIRNSDFFFQDLFWKFVLEFLHMIPIFEYGFSQTFYLMRLIWKIHQRFLQKFFFRFLSRGCLGFIQSFHQEVLHKFSQPFVQKFLQNVFLVIFQEIFREIIQWIPTKGFPVLSGILSNIPSENCFSQKFVQCFSKEWIYFISVGFHHRSW